ncbi:Hypothetical predicted protein [Olea europaea subsp. europaea]|uniref:DCD domain-containing protein n=1 Tax=Olea europaea subsp. europaea TaxID=158383 RepID=A0A8S0PX74_OLEEU|nr:Hypothetical predicted protein [Olea europaea subsp. europaea]
MVIFEIFKECLPLHESALRHVIKEKYEGCKFKQELSGKQERLMFLCGKRPPPPRGGNGASASSWSAIFPLSTSNKVPSCFDGASSTEQIPWNSSIYGTCSYSNRALRTAC